MSQLLISAVPWQSIVFWGTIAVVSFVLVGTVFALRRRIPWPALAALAKHPFAKYVVLSVVAHVALLIWLFTSQLFNPPPIGPGPPAVVVRLGGRSGNVRRPADPERETPDAVPAVAPELPFQETGSPEVERPHVELPPEQPPSDWEIELNEFHVQQDSADLLEASVPELATKAQPLQAAAIQPQQPEPNLRSEPESEPETEFNSFPEVDDTQPSELPPPLQTQPETAQKETIAADANNVAADVPNGPTEEPLFSPDEPQQNPVFDEQPNDQPEIEAFADTRDQAFANDQMNSSAQFPTQFKPRTPREEFVQTPTEVPQVAVENTLVATEVGALRRVGEFRNSDPDKATKSRQDPEISKNKAFATASVVESVQTSARQQNTSPQPTRADGSAVPSIYRDRWSADRDAIARARGGSAETERGVQAALRWLAAAQSEDGRWDASRFGSGQPTFEGGHSRRGAGTNADTGTTGLAILAFLGAGHTYVDGEYADVVLKGVNYLVRTQHRDGSLFGDAEYFAAMYCHGIATLALSEAYSLTGDERLLPSVVDAITYTRQAQHPSTGGWRYRRGQEGDTSQMGWQLMALTSAHYAGLDIPSRTWIGADRFLQKVTFRDGRAAYRPGQAPSAAMTAEAMLCRLFLRSPTDDPQIQSAANYLVAHLPGDGRTNYYYWYYGTLALYHLQDANWRRWNSAVKRTLVARQDSDGSWSADSVWGTSGGKVYSTALAALTLEVYYRYRPLRESQSAPSDNREAAHTASRSK